MVFFHVFGRLEIFIFFFKIFKPFFQSLANFFLRYFAGNALRVNYDSSLARYQLKPSFTVERIVAWIAAVTILHGFFKWISHIYTVTIYHTTFQTLFEYCEIGINTIALFSTFGRKTRVEIESFIRLLQVGDSYSRN